MWTVYKYNFAEVKERVLIAESDVLSDFQIKNIKKNARKSK